MPTRKLLLLIMILSWYSCQAPLPDAVTVAMKELPETLDYNIHIKPILSDNCFSCHGPDEAARHGGFRLDMAESAYSKSKESGKRPIVPNKPGKSELIQRITSTDPNYLMPTPDSHLTLDDREKAMLVKWIKEGAEYKAHWAFIVPEKPEIPISGEYDAHPIDHFIKASLDQNGLEANEEADRELLLRRLSLDLTGLPPTLKEMDDFLEDGTKNAYEKQVDRLLAASHYGEQMAMHWMDVARYADTHGYTVDRFREMSPWRDWVIKAYNENLPYDRFVLYQMAGDLLPNPSKDQKLATAFNRIHPQNMEGGIVQEEFRVEYVADRTNTLGKAFMALSLECARCHDHKYDPISQKEYFQLSSFFNQVDEAGQISWDDAMPVPTTLWNDEEKDQLLEMLEDEVSKVAKELERVKMQEQEAIEKWLSQERYHPAGSELLPSGIKARFDFESLPLSNLLGKQEKGVMESNEVRNEQPELVEGLKGKAALLNGDAWLRMGGVGSFSRTEDFSVGLWVKIPKELESGAVFHTGSGAVLYNRRGYHLYLKDNKLELVLAHTAPYNAIIKETHSGVPRDQWVHLMITYDGSSSAKGLKLFVNGENLTTETKKDNLYKDILFKGNNQPGIQIGAVWRGKGLKGALVDELTVFNRELSQLEVMQLGNHQGFQKIVQKPRQALSEEEQNYLAEYYFKSQSIPDRRHHQQLEDARKKYNDEVEPIQEVMVMDDMDKKRPTFILERGEYHAHGEEVMPETPESILPMPEAFPKNRLGLAKWLVHKDHPLTSRVAVNRIWQQFFGRGLVASSSDFGNQGDMPSHPELLDWLAVRFRESGWDVKALQKLIVMSGTYRQSSLATPETKEKDPDNTWLSRGPSGRLPGEMIRDNVLYASGMLSEKIGGPSVKPYQPAGLWSVNGGQYVEGQGQDLFRRSLYTFWKRSVPHPTLHIFDAPERSTSTIQRQETNTPLQALVLMNDPIYVEASKVLGAHISGYAELKEGIKQIFRKLTGRHPRPAELGVLMELRENEYRKFKTSPEKMKGWLAEGSYDIQGKIDPYHWAANTVVASAMINADATITKR